MSGRRPAVQPARTDPGWHGPWYRGAMCDHRQAKRAKAAERAAKTAGRRRRQAGSKCPVCDGLSVADGTSRLCQACGGTGLVS